MLLKKVVRIRELTKYGEKFLADPAVQLPDNIISIIIIWFTRMKNSLGSSDSFYAQICSSCSYLRHSLNGLSSKFHNFWSPSMLLSTVGKLFTQQRLIDFFRNNFLSIRLCLLSEHYGANL